MENTINSYIVNDSELNFKYAYDFADKEKELANREIEDPEEYFNSLKRSTKIAAEVKITPEEENLNNYYRTNHLFKTPKNKVSSFIGFSNEEEGQDDLIFDNWIALDSDLRLEDHKQFIYSTLPTDMYVMYSNNMVTPIARHPNIASKVQGYYKKQNWVGEYTGIYIVDYFSLKMLKTNTKEYSNVMRYLEYAHSCGVLESVVFNNLNNLLAKGNYYNKYLRIITIVTSSNLMQNNPIYVPHTGLCIGDESLLDNYVHPATKQYKHNVGKIVESDVKNYIEIDIVDNTSVNDYYIKVGNKVLKLEQERNFDKPEQVGISLWKNNRMVSTEYTDLDKINSLGIYNSIKQAELEGNAGKEIENKAKELAIEENKLNTQRLNSENDLKSAHYKSTKIGLELQRDIVKNDFELDKLKIEKEILKNKYQFEIENNLIEIQLRNHKLVSDIVMAKLGLINAEMKFAAEEIKHEFDMEKFRMDMRKARENSITTTIDAIGKIIKLIGACL